MGKEVQLCSGLMRDLGPRGGGSAVVEKTEWDTLIGSTISTSWQVVQVTSFSHEAPEENKNLKESSAILVPSIGPIQYTCGERGGTQIRACVPLFLQYPAWEWIGTVTAKAESPSYPPTCRKLLRTGQRAPKKTGAPNFTEEKQSIRDPWNLLGFRSPTNLLTLGPVTLVASHPKMLPVPSHLCWPQGVCRVHADSGKGVRDRTEGSTSWC